MFGETYTVPYGPEVTIITPAIWSGNCPKTLLLHGEEKVQDASTPSKSLTPLSISISDLDRSHPTVGTTYDETIDKTPTSTGTGTSLITTTVSTSISVEKDSTTTKSHETTFLTDSEPINKPSDATSKSVEPTATSTSLSQNTVNSTPTSVPNSIPATKLHKSTVSVDRKPTGQTTGITSHNVNTVAKPTKGTKDAESLTASAEANSSTNGSPDAINSKPDRSATGVITRNADPATTESTKPHSPTTGSHKTTDRTDGKPASQVTTDVTTGTSKPTPTKSGKTAASTTGSCPCWTDCELQEEDSTLSKKIGLEVAKLFCNQFIKAPLTSRNLSKIAEYRSFVVGAHRYPGCTKSELDETKCLEYLEEIEKQCPRTGGFFERGCFYVWIMNREAT
ncbi:uncharacterized protein FMAN_14302 [Fusarium mangiferae]|uniref:Uncharacterized protein n=1 Tax=Fusarium mangiferae TaxID=192010 RepID=A0A1L7ULL5_FUSMA|nr:uncharacterized protein FMAN_14302 [Fusarium mangiferae]CVL09363.1 uncharacterized protein FMAN_14302 [Fusarium mangiferae]